MSNLTIEVSVIILFVLFSRWTLNREVKSLHAQFKIDAEINEDNNKFKQEQADIEYRMQAIEQGNIFFKEWKMEYYYKQTYAGHGVDMSFIRLTHPRLVIRNIYIANPVEIDFYQIANEEFEKKKQEFRKGPDA